MTVQTFHSIPEVLIEGQPADLLDALKGPSLVHIPGRLKPKIFLSMLLHGNEHTGFFAVQKFLRKYLGREFPRDILLFVGNVAATNRNLRMLEAGVDFNRIWGDEESSLADLYRHVRDEAFRGGLFALVDIHNNTGKNPYYACVSQLKKDHLYLASLFSRTIVYFRHPKTALSCFFSQFVPSITLECGMSRDELGIEKAFQYIDAVSHLHEFPKNPLAPNEMNVYETVGRMWLPKSLNLAFSSDPMGKQEQADIVLRGDIDCLNFVPLKSNQKIGELKPGVFDRIKVESFSGKSYLHKFLKADGNALLTKKDIVPSMFTLDRKVIEEDCLGYIMEEVCLDSRLERDES